jgi:hypothetical protein
MMDLGRRPVSFIEAGSRYHSGWKCALSANEEVTRV